MDETRDGEIISFLNPIMLEMTATYWIMNTNELEGSLENAISGGEFDVDVEELMDELHAHDFGLGNWNAY